MRHQYEPGALALADSDTAALVRDEAAALRAVHDAGLPAPEPVAADADGRESDGHPAILMTRLPGRPDVTPADPEGWLRQIAAMAARIHDGQVAAPPPFRSRIDAAAPVIPASATRPAVWEAAFALLRQQAPEPATCFIHRSAMSRRSSPSTKATIPLCTRPRGSVRKRMNRAGSSPSSRRRPAHPATIALMCRIVPGGVQLAFGPFGLPALDGDFQHALGEPPRGLADQLLPAADTPEQGQPGHAELIGQALHVQPPALVDPPGGGRHDAGGQLGLAGLGAVAFRRAAGQGTRGRDLFASRTQPARPVPAAELATALPP